MKICGSGWLVIIGPAQRHKKLQCFCKYNLSHLRKPSRVQMRKFRMEAETVVQCIWASYCCAPDTLSYPWCRFNNPITSPNINQHYSDVKNAVWSLLCLCCYSCFIRPTAPVSTNFMENACFHSSSLPPICYISLVLFWTTLPATVWVSVLAESCAEAGVHPSVYQTATAIGDTDSGGLKMQSRLQSPHLDLHITQAQKPLC